MALHRLPLLLLVLTAIVPLFTASASHSQLPPEHAAARRRHHPSPATASPATVQFHPVTSATSSMPKNHLGMDQSPSTLEAMAGNPQALPVPPQAATPPPPPQAPALLLQEDSDSEGSSSASASPAAASSTTTTTLLPLLNQRAAAASASSASPVQAGVARVVGWGSEEGLLPLARVLTALGYDEMVSAATLHPNLPRLARWHGPITIFAPPDISLQTSCSMCSRRRLLLDHIALGYYPYSELTAAPTIKIPSASVNLCLNIDTVSGTFSVHHARLFVEGVETSHPEVYNDGRYIVHGLRTFLQPLSRYSCFDRSHSYHCHGDSMPTRSDATSVSMSAMRVSVRIREAIARLRDAG
ncbi:unnamed protein product [Triticum turgidum subsp. durum]|uniref:FAS1 domain-containing protein n=1 Tax=Triticum turgidum subsp. durum TaxID=4567 RepID=A0A9R0QRW3_TRITD|nr:unnamed protein product [Triticum turgidum subsp. durum]